MDARWGERPEREGQLELVGDQNLGSEASSRSKRGESKGEVRGGATATEAMEKCRYDRVFKGEEVRRDEPIEYVLPTGVRSTF